MSNLPYQNTALSPLERAKDLLGRMTVKEKVKQLQCVLKSPETYEFENGMGEMYPEGILVHESPEQTAAAIRVGQERCIASSRFGIPVVMHNEALSGVCMNFATVFPTSIGLAASFDPETVRDMADRTRQQMLAVGYRQALSPVLDVSRDMRWGRISETYGPDPTLSARMSVAFVKGLQTDELKNGASATGKHFMGHGASEGGINQTRTVADARELREVYAKPFDAAIHKAGIGSVMNSYCEINGEPVCASRGMLTDMLRGDLGFDGPVTSDYGSIQRLVYNFRTARDMADAAAQCLKAGLDIECPTPLAYDKPLLEAYAKGMVTDEDIDTACLRVLKFKFELGLFEDPMPKEETIRDAFFKPEHTEKAKEAARRTMTLTKNDGVLPLRNKSIKVAVIGPTGNNRRFMYSGYIFGTLVDMNLARLEQIGTEHRPLQRRDFDPLDESPKPVRTFPFTPDEALEMINRRLKNLYPESRTVYEAIHETFPDSVYVRGCHYLDKADTDFDTAVSAAKDADLVILTVGSKCGWGPMTNNGEGTDNSHIGLPAAQSELVKVVAAAAKQCVIVHTDERPLIDAEAYKAANAVLEAWLPNTWGPDAICDVLTGAYNPGGRLPFDVPYAEGVGPVYHYMNNGSHRFTCGLTNGYRELPDSILLPFGYGLSYTSFEYSNINLSSDGAENPTLTISADITNTGYILGDEVVQLYTRDLLASKIRPYQELAGFCRVTLAPGETKTVRFTVRADQFAFIGREGKWILEEGDFAFYIGRDSLSRREYKVFTQPKTIGIDPAKRGFYAEAEIL